MSRTLALSVVALAIAQAPALAQVVARQGTPPPPTETHYASPMILELPLPDVRPLQRGSTLRLAEVRNYICDSHVRLQGLTIAKQYVGPKKARSLQLILSGSISVSDSYDRLVDITVRIKTGETTMVSHPLRNVSAEEERVTPFRIRVPVAEPRLESAYASTVPPTVELTLTVRDNS